eukprot:TRINITY_DN67890_c0_g1_i1.p2 TRINITY_DN67890_c0_g1~~TRINITY_DN67890_c0_g1_i1.p2  ORF type:complete len:148 (-),score=26.58 TRINITY_DN67890_c0_g1_i1:38-481(-)
MVAEKHGKEGCGQNIPTRSSTCTCPSCTWNKKTSSCEMEPTKIFDVGATVTMPDVGMEATLIQQKDGHYRLKMGDKVVTHVFTCNTRGDYVIKTEDYTGGALGAGDVADHTDDVAKENMSQLPEVASSSNTSHKATSIPRRSTIVSL